jgi:lipid-A-disaccharide synthase
MVDAARRIGERLHGVRFLLSPAAAVDPGLVERLAKGHPPDFERVTGRTYEVMAGADLILVASGTATLEAALFGTPMVVCYKFSPLTGLAGRLLVSLPRVSLANIVAGRPVVPELLQRAATGRRLAGEALSLLQSPERLDAQRRAFAEIKAALGAPGVGERAARRVLEVAEACA